MLVMQNQFVEMVLMNEFWRRKDSNFCVETTEYGNVSTTLTTNHVVKTGACVCATVGTQLAKPARASSSVETDKREVSYDFNQEHTTHVQ